MSIASLLKETVGRIATFNIVLDPEPEVCFSIEVSLDTNVESRVL